MDHRATSTEERHAYLLLRFLTGLDFFGHGFARVFTGTHLAGFARSMATGMEAAPLPAWLTLASGYAIPCVELVIGTLLLAGVGVRFALGLAFGLMFVLMVGVTLKQDWNAAGQQMVYGLVLAVLMFARQQYDRSWVATFANR